MDAIACWQQKIQTYSAEGVQVVSCDDPDARKALEVIVGGEFPNPVQSFLHLWEQKTFDPWEVLVQSAAILNPEVMVELTENALLRPLHSLLLRSEQAAILSWTQTASSSARPWGYLLQIRSKHAGGEPAHLVLHLPASPGELRAAEAVLRLKLPPTFQRFLLLTNGIGADAREQPLIYGAGPMRADWKAVQLNEWLTCEQFPEIAARWRAFQGVYDYERILDWERGEETFLSDETLLVPFGYTYETWCFDRSRPAVDREYPVIFWDHETREATDAYPDFACWLVGEIESYLFNQ